MLKERINTKIIKTSIEKIPERESVHIKTKEFMTNVRTPRVFIILLFETTTSVINNGVAMQHIKATLFGFANIRGSYNPKILLDVLLMNCFKIAGSNFKNIDQ